MQGVLERGIFFFLIVESCSKPQPSHTQSHVHSHLHNVNISFFFPVSPKSAFASKSLKALNKIQLLRPLPRYSK